MSEDKLELNQADLKTFEFLYGKNFSMKKKNFKSTKILNAYVLTLTVTGKQQGFKWVQTPK